MLIFCHCFKIFRNQHFTVVDIRLVSWSLQPAGQGIKTNFLSDDFFFFSLFVPGVPYSVPGFLLYVQYLAGCRESNPSCCDRSQVCYHWATHIPLNLLIKIYVVNYNCGTIQYIYCTIYSVISCRCIPLLVSCYSPVYCIIMNTGPSVFRYCTGFHKFFFFFKWPL